MGTKKLFYKCPLCNKKLVSSGYYSHMLSSHKGDVSRAFIDLYRLVKIEKYQKKTLIKILSEI